MTELVRTVRSGAVGLDLALGGGIRFVRRTHLADRESATLLIRGGPGTGKSVLAEDLALRLAAELGGDALYVCVEVLPSEVRAQRMGFEPFDPTCVVDLSDDTTRDPNAKKPCLVLGMRDVPLDEDGVPDLGSAMIDLARIAVQRGFNPKVVVVDSLSDGYELGSKVPRPIVDGVCKLAIEQGWALILIEEVADASVSHWAFAVDTVLSLRVAPAASPAQAKRELLVTKHRFGPCEPGPHRLQIDPNRVRVIPPFAAYRNAVRDLSLPPPSKDRSLMIPVVGTPPDLEAFRVPDSEGRCVVVTGAVDSKELDVITRKICELRGDGTLTSGHKVTFWLRERSRWQFEASETGFSVGTLHQFIDGEDWLEEALTLLSHWRGEIAHVRVGLTDHVNIYENAVGLHRATSLLLHILEQCGLVAVLFGSDTETHTQIRAAIVDTFWDVSHTKNASSKEGRITISTDEEPPLKFIPKLDD
jgi:KaiC/GvpD/RAD55 family RecA-like ATPase